MGRVRLKLLQLFFQTSVKPQARILAIMDSEQKRNRSTANHAVSVKDYENMCQQWLTAGPGFIHDTTGPLCKDQRSVTPSSILALYELLTSFLDAGLCNGMVLPSRLEAGIKGALALAEQKLTVLYIVYRSASCSLRYNRMFS